MASRKTVAAMAFLIPRALGAMVAGAALLMTLVVSACSPATTPISSGPATAPISSNPTTASISSSRATAPPSSGTWSRVPHDGAVFGGFSLQTMHSVTAGGVGLVAVGDDWSGEGPDAAVWFSQDGTTWSRVTHDEAVFGGESFQKMHSVTAGGPGLVVVGSDWSGDDPVAAVWTSRYGVTWSRIPHNEAAFGGKGWQEMNSVTGGGPGLVAVGIDWPGSGVDARAAVWTSVDGITWSRVPHDEAVFGGERAQFMTSVTIGGPGLVAVGFDQSGGSFGYLGIDRDAAVWTSVDGITWSRVPHDEAVFGGEGFQEMNSVTAGGPGLVAVGTDESGGDSDTAVWTSADGITWSRVSHDEAVFGGEFAQEMSSVIAGGPGLVAVGADSRKAAVWTSPDGITWSQVPGDEAVFGGEHSQEMHSVTAGGPGLVAVGADKSGDWDAAVWLVAGEP